LGHRSYHKEWERHGKSARELRARDLGVADGRYELSVRIGELEKTASFFIGKKDAEFEKRLRSFKKSNSFFHQQERHQMFDAATRLLPLSRDLMRTSGVDWKKWKNTLKETNLVKVRKSQASKYFYPDDWVALSGIKDELKQLAESARKSPDHPVLAKQSQELTRKLEALKEHSLKLSLWRSP
jgi:hypothetical protein